MQRTALIRTGFGDYDPPCDPAEEEYQIALEIKAEQIESALYNWEEIDGLTRADVDDWMDGENHIDTINEIRWLLFMCPEILNNHGYTELQNKITLQMRDRIDGLASESLKAIAADPD